MFGDKKLLARQVDFITVHYTTLQCTILHYTKLHNKILLFTTLYFTSLHFTSLHYSTLTTLYWSSQKELIEVLDKIWLEVGDKEESQD